MSRDFIRIAMFSGPRNISTTMLRAFENRPDTAVYDEPFYACYLRESGARHPMRDDVLAAQPVKWGNVVKNLSNPPLSGEPIAFEKHIAFHFAGGGPLDWIMGCRVFQLIRGPRAMVASYKNKYEDVAPIIDSLDIQRRIYVDCIARGVSCPVIDSSDIQKDPEGVLRALCKALDIPFSEKMLSWPAGRRDSDGVWAPHWYDAVESSTGFRPYEEKDIRLSPELEAIAEQCQPDYRFLYERRLTAG